MDKGTYDSLGQQQTANTKVFTWWVLLAQVSGLTAVVLVAVWMGHFRGGFAWTEKPGIEFNYHPLFMIIGMVFLYSDAILVYRVFRNERKLYIKILHAVLHILALIFAVVALKAVFDSHNLPAKPFANLYSLHSWVGLTTVILFGLQWTLGFVGFLFPKFNAGTREVMLPMHKYFGIAIFAMAIVSAISGITEKLIFTFAGEYSKKGTEAILANCLGLVLVFHGLIVGYIITNSNWKRQPLPEEETMQLTGTQ
ncbi:transmembrane ascorbate-dependent reductase CYB561-like isoform X2 [Lineus longissimus]|uniref:transmembrane ascorbate-dependent reductase CYB561-like isoform X2 n=1 Tax=Lineus longissimus TaxID=88925 RepID=UPI002B4DDD63